MNDTCKEDGVENIRHNSSGEPKAAVKAKRKSTVEKGLEAVFDKFKNAANEDFERYIMSRLLAGILNTVGSGCRV